ncbi:S8 family peptidase [Microaerobacter geothermalis]|uniref:S8 family peptidase n=1 Tax=Microaerobacter geothermalis TaxID=674972 RepID=UPI001F2D58E7|nr:S8 family peptidase [Microaerobacter geothermalis]MCF6095173.1 S8 family peptidase [Microaerobacter geothermalis]
MREYRKWIGNGITIILAVSFSLFSILGVKTETKKYPTLTVQSTLKEDIMHSQQLMVLENQRRLDRLANQYEETKSGGDSRLKISVLQNGDISIKWMRILSKEEAKIWLNSFPLQKERDKIPLFSPLKNGKVLMTIVDLKSVEKRMTKSFYTSTTGLGVETMDKGSPKSHYIKNEVIVKFNRSLSNEQHQQILKNADAKLVRKLSQTCVVRSNSLTTRQLIQYFKGRKEVSFVEPHYIYLPNLLPNDYFYKTYQWNLPIIHSEQGWEISKGNEGVVIAVVDTGIDPAHPEFAGRLVDGYNSIEDNSNVRDEHGHGTHVAGIIAAKTNNGEGVAGITWLNKIMPIKAIGSSGEGSSFDIAKGIIWAADHGASVINMSLGNYADSFVVREAIQYAFSKDAVLVAASGNDNSSQPGYPAAYSEVLAVAATGFQDTRADFSNFGPYIDVSAPGVNIPSTFPDHQYAALSGTSMASPHVAGLAGLIRATNPYLTNVQVMELIRNSTKDLGEPGYDPYFGYGVIDIELALKQARENKKSLSLLKKWLERRLTMFQQDRELIRLSEGKDFIRQFIHGEKKNMIEKEIEKYFNGNKSLSVNQYGEYLIRLLQQEAE